MASVYFSVVHLASKTVFFRFYDPAQDKLFDFDDDTWQASPTTEAFAATEKTAMGDADESLYRSTAALDLADLNTTTTPMYVTVQAIDDLGTDEIIDTFEIVIVSSDLAAAPAIRQADVTASIVAHNLDHLALTATGAADMTTEVADNTILSRILANGDTSAFVPSTDGLQLIRDEVDGLQGTDGKCAISTDAQDLSGTLDVNTKTITANAITATAINADAITNAKIADDAIAVENIKDAAITAGKIASDAITASKFDESTAFPLTAADSGSTEVARTGADGDTLETLSDEIAVLSASLPSIGSGSETVNHDYGGSDALSYLTSTGQGIDNADVRAYLKSEWDANPLTATVRAHIITDTSGQWVNAMQLDPGIYTLVYSKQGAFGNDEQEVTVT